MSLFAINLSEKNRADYHQNLLAWFDVYQRDFPWRKTSNPFHILLAEKLLQQTLARSTAVKSYLELVSQYSTPQQLAEADIEELEKIIRPLGFLYRAKELRFMARELVDKYHSKVPADLKELLDLPGIGDYCARAVLSFAYGQDVPIVDTNVARLLYRLCGIEGALPSNPARHKELISLAGSLLPPGNSRNYNLAVLDLCALVCKPKNPLCSICPLKEICAYGRRRSHNAT